MSRCPCVGCRHCDRLDNQEGYSNVEEPYTTEFEQSKPPSRPVVQAVSFDPEGLSYLVDSTDQLKELQMEDADIEPIIQWLKKSNTRPAWEDISAQSGATKAYWAQWQSL